MDESADLNCTISITWDAHSPSEWVGRVLAGGFKVDMDMLLVDITQDEADMNNRDYHGEIEAGWNYYDGECYHGELPIDGFCELSDFVSDNVNLHLNHLNSLRKK